MQIRSGAIILFCALVLLSSCTSVEQASRHHRSHRNYDSLKILHNQLYIGMPRAEVESLLGEPDYSPIDGQYYYASDRTVDWGDSTATYTLVVVYDAIPYGEDEIVSEYTGKLEWFNLFPVGE